MNNERITNIENFIAENATAARMWRDFANEQLGTFGWRPTPPNEAPPKPGLFCTNTLTHFADCILSAMNRDDKVSQVNIMASEQVPLPGSLAARRAKRARNNAMKAGEKLADEVFAADDKSP